MNVGEGGRIVLDNGTGMVKAGFSGDDVPRAVFPPRVGRPRDQGTSISGATKDTYVGDEAYVKRNILSPPSEDPDVINWDDMEKIWFHTFYNELRISPEHYSILITEPPFITKSNRMKTAEIMFETFRIEGFYAITSAVLATIASGRTTGMVFDSGHSASYAVPVYELSVIKHAVERNALAGKALDKYLAKLLNEKGYSFTTSQELQQVQIKKETLSARICANSGHAESNSEICKVFELPDGKTINVDSELDKCCDALFNPSLTGDNYSLGAHKLIHSALTKCNEDLRPELINNGFTTGGSTMYKSFHDRLQSELNTLVDSSNVKVVATDNPKYDPWVGGSILASISTFETMQVHKDEYNEWGSKAVLWKCF